MPGVAVVCDAGGIADVQGVSNAVQGVSNAARVADDGYARHGVGESHDILGWAILLINTINNPWMHLESCRITCN